MPAQRPQKPDWDLWFAKAEVQLWEAIHLSLDVCPERTDPEVLRKREQSREYRIRFANAASNLGKQLEPTRLSLNGSRYATVRLADFAAFVKSRGWDHSWKLSSLAAEPPKAEAKPLAQRERNTLYALLSALIEDRGVDLSKATTRDAWGLEDLTQRHGWRVSDRTIFDLLKKIHEAKKRRSESDEPDDL